MVYREFGKTGVKLSRLGFGAMRLPIDKKDDGTVTGIEKSAELIRHGIEKGINYIDSAPFYSCSESEVAVGEAIKSYPRDSVYVSTKNPLQNACGDCWRWRLETSLRKLRTHYIDFYHFWDLSWEKYTGKAQGENGPLDKARKVLDEGIIRHLSFSSHDTPENVHKLIDTGEFESMLVQYNLLDRQYEECIQHASEAGLGTVVMGPVGGGRLGTASEVISSATGVPSTAETALRYVFANPRIDVAISGMGTKQMVDENVATAERGETLSAGELAGIDALVEENKKLLDMPCTGCNYCTPCPQDVAIPTIFQMQQWHDAFDLKPPARRRYQNLGKGEQKNNKPATECTECGECQDKCPQNISIIDKLKDAHTTLSADPAGA